MAQDPLDDPHVVTSTASIRVLFKRTPNARIRTTCATCKTTARRVGVDSAVDWFVNHDCKHKTQDPIISKAEARRLEAEERAEHGWRWLAEQEWSILDAVELGRMLDRIVGTDGPPRRNGILNMLARADQRNPKQQTVGFDELAARRTVKMEAVMTDTERIARLEEAMVEIARLGLRLARMFPESELPRDTVDAFLAQVLGSRDLPLAA